MKARVVELVDTQDLKSCDLTVVPVRFRLRAPFFDYRYKRVFPFFSTASALRILSGYPKIEINRNLQ
jgi:hypothetical protein